MIKIRRKKFAPSKAAKPGEPVGWIPFFCPLCSRKLRAQEQEYNRIKACPACKEQITFPDPSFSLGQLIADYMVDGWISHGSMGEVYMAHNTKTNQTVALKLLNSQLSTEDGMALFKQEQDLLSYMRHPNIVRENGSGEFHGVQYIAMDYVDGECVDHILMRYDFLPESMVLAILRQAADALGYVWDTFGYRHRDIKPGNLMIDEHGNLTIIDWGMAKQKYFNADQQVLGSPLFMDPVSVRQATGLDQRSDIYSMGVTCFHMLTGDYPFFAEDVETLIDHVLADPIPDIREFKEDISENTATLIKYMMGKKYHERYQTWAEVLNGVNEVMRSS